MNRAGAVLGLDFEGVRLAAVPGETVAAALVAHGRLAQSTGKDGQPRGIYCGMGVCHDCLVTIDGRRSQRACLVKAADGMQVRSHAAGRVALDESLTNLCVVPGAPPPVRVVDLLVVGAGPGGLAAAEACGKAGASVLIVDERPAPGGQFYKQPASAAVEAAGGLDAQARAGRNLIDRVKSLGVTIEGETLVWGAFRDSEGRLDIATCTHGRIEIVKPRLLVVAAGAYERPMIVPGWTLPGVMTTGAAQTLIRSYGVVPGGRVLIAGNGPLNLQVAAELRRAGAQVIAVDAAPPPWRRAGRALALIGLDVGLALQGMATIGHLRVTGVPVHWGHRLIRIEGGRRAERAIIAPVRPDGRIVQSSARSIAVDAVCTGDGFWPAAELPRLLGCQHRPSPRGGPHLEVERREDGATSLPDVFVVGEAGGFGGARIAEAQGTLAGLEALRRLGISAPTRGPEERSLPRARRFQAALWRLFAAKDVGLSLAEAETIVCRCEAVRLEALQQAISDQKIGDVATLKRLTRAGMGRCQGRYCEPRLHELVGGATPACERAFLAPQMPLRPTPLAALAVEAPEWGGHARTGLPPDPTGAAEPIAFTETDTLVIGAGIVGLSTALFLARAGHAVTVLDRGHPNAGASGGNAGSLHAQLLSFDHGARAEAGGGPAARTLPLQLESIKLWQRLEQELRGDFEIKITGGLMVAETERDLDFLTAKTAVERRHGIDSQVIGAAELRDLEPALDHCFVGAAHCPSEGKINPLCATQAILAAAVAAGAQIHSETTVTGIRREGPGFVAETSRGAVRAGRVVNAAGAFASRIGVMLGLDVPVFGAPLQMIVTEAAEPLVTHLVAHADRHLTLKQAANGNVIIGGGWTAGLDPVHQHPRPTRNSLQGNLWVAQHVLPALRKLHVLRSWAAMNINIDGAPILGEHPAVPGVFTAVTSNGYTLGPLMGLTTAELILHGRANRDISAFAITRFGAATREARQ